MILTRKQGEQIARQGQTRKRIVEILSEIGFVVVDDTERERPEVVKLTVMNTDGTDTCIYRPQPREGYVVNVCKRGHRAYPLS